MLVNIVYSFVREKLTYLLTYNEIFVYVVKSGMKVLKVSVDSIPFS